MWPTENLGVRSNIRKRSFSAYLSVCPILSWHFSFTLTALGSVNCHLPRLMSVGGPLISVRVEQLMSFTILHCRENALGSCSLTLILWAAVPQGVWALMPSCFSWHWIVQRAKLYMTPGWHTGCSQPQLMVRLGAEKHSITLLSCVGFQHVPWTWHTNAKPLCANLNLWCP